MCCIGSKDPDYIHMNSVFIDPKDNHLIVSLANGYTVLKIHRQTGEILWRLGGKLDEFSLTDNQRFRILYQHRHHIWKVHKECRMAGGLSDAVILRLVPQGILIKTPKHCSHCMSKNRIFHIVLISPKHWIRCAVL